MFEKIEKKLLSLLQESTKKFLSSPSLKSHAKEIPEITLEIPKEKEFGDLSSNVALRLSSALKLSPRSIAEGIAAELKGLAGKGAANTLIADVQVKGAGFINIFLHPQVFFDLLKDINENGEDFCCFGLGGNSRLLLEFVSANPTGALSVAHARQAAVGDALARIMSKAGYRVTKEYYLNDKGNQINILGRSISLRFKELCGEAIVFPEDHYQGQYITELAKELFDDEAQRKKILRLDAGTREGFFIKYGVDKILAVIKKELKDFGVEFDLWYSQKELEEKGMIENLLGQLGKKGFIYEAEGALWFKSTQFGDDKDRVVRKSDGSYTYLAPDMAYHADKFKRGFSKLINIWGPDHHGYIPRIKAAVRALGKDEQSLHVIIVQLATLFRQGQPVPMSTRKGQYVTLTEVLNEVGRDAARFFFLMRKTDSHLDFDLELAKTQTADNPVYYVQYAHARISGILSEAAKKKINLKGASLSLLKEEEELDLMKSLFGFPYCLYVCAKQLDPYAVTAYLQSLASSFHRFYDRHKVLSDDEDLTKARLYLIRAAKIVLSCGLNLIGVSSPERM